MPFPGGQGPCLAHSQVACYRFPMVHLTFGMHSVLTCFLNFLLGARHPQNGWKYSSKIPIHSSFLGPWDAVNEGKTMMTWKQGVAPSQITAMAPGVGKDPRSSIEIFVNPISSHLSLWVQRGWLGARKHLLLSSSI